MDVWPDVVCRQFQRCACHPSSLPLQANAALKRQMDGMAVQLLSVQADAVVARQGTARLQQQLRAARAERAAAMAQTDAGMLELLQLQVGGRQLGCGLRVPGGDRWCLACHTRI